MFGAISRRLVTGGALLLTAFLATDAADIDDDLPALKRALLESRAAFEESVKAANDWERHTGIEWQSTDPVAERVTVVRLSDQAA